MKYLEKSLVPSTLGPIVLISTYKPYNVRVGGKPLPAYCSTQQHLDMPDKLNWSVGAPGRLTSEGVKKALRGKTPISEIKKKKNKKKFKGETILDIKSPTLYDQRLHNCSTSIQFRAKGVGKNGKPIHFKTSNLVSILTNTAYQQAPSQGYHGSNFLVTHENRSGEWVYRLPAGSATQVRLLPYIRVLNGPARRVFCRHSIFRSAVPLNPRYYVDIALPIMSITPSTGALYTPFIGLMSISPI